MHFEDFEALQRTRESCRVYSDKPISRELLTHLVEVAGLSPSACNSQPWRFIVVDDPEVKGRMGEVLGRPGSLRLSLGRYRVPAFTRHLRRRQPTLKPSCGWPSTDPSTLPQMDIGMAAMSLCCEASSLGLGTVCLEPLTRRRPASC